MTNNMIQTSNLRNDERRRSYTSYPTENVTVEKEERKIPKVEIVYQSPGLKKEINN